jgi:hypothetical protein
VTRVCVCPRATHRVCTVLVTCWRRRASCRRAAALVAVRSWLVEIGGAHTSAKVIAQLRGGSVGRRERDRRHAVAEMHDAQTGVIQRCVHDGQRRRWRQRRAQHGTRVARQLDQVGRRRAVSGPLSALVYPVPALAAELAPIRRTGRPRLASLLHVALQSCQPRGRLVTLRVARQRRCDDNSHATYHSFVRSSHVQPLSIIVIVVCILSSVRTCRLMLLLLLLLLLL